MAEPRGLTWLAPGGALLVKAHKAIAAAVATLLVFGVVIGFGSTRGAAVPPTRTPWGSADFGAQWLVTQADPSGAIGGSTVTPDVYSNTVQAALSLAAASQGETTFDRALGWLSDHAAAQVPTDGSASPGLIGFLLLVVDRVGMDPTQFGGVDLIAALQATLQPSGLYGTSSPTFDGVYRQSIALMGLSTTGVAPPGAAIGWLKGQQCGDTPAASKGGWQAYRADTTVPCGVPDPVGFTGPDTNSTAVASMALDAVGTAPNSDPFDYLEAVQDPDGGGFAFISGPDVDANSTALVLSAIHASGGDPTTAPWNRANGNPQTSLMSWQIGCGDPTTVGAFQANWKPGPDLQATIQAVWGIARVELTDIPQYFERRSVFTDVCQDTTPFLFENAITVMASKGIANGHADGSFRPREVVSRGALAAFTNRGAGAGSFEPTVQTFSDVPPSHPFYKEIEWTVDRNISQGYPDGTYRPSEPATRQSVAAFIYRRMGSPAFTPTGQTFSDVPPSHPFFTEIEWAVAHVVAGNPIIQGYPDGTFRPTNPTTRQVMMAWMWRLRW